MIDQYKVTNKHNTEKNDSVMNDSMCSIFESECIAKSITMPKPFNYIFGSMLPCLERPSYDQSFFRLTEEEKLADLG